MRLRTPLTSLALSLLVLSGMAAAQLPQAGQGAGRESEEEKAKARKELERKALVMLDETLAMAQTLKLAENRASVRVQAADMLWKHDEKRARALFRDAAADIAVVLGDEGARRDRSFWMLAQLRPQLLYTAAARDAQFALELLRDSRPAAAAEGSEAASPSTDPEAELRLEQALAAQLAESDPKAALRAAEESLSKGVTFGVLDILARLRRKDAEVASQLAVKIVEKLRGQTLSGGREAFSVAAALLSVVLLPQEAGQQYYFSGYAAAPPPPARSAEKPKPLVLDDSVVRELCEMLAGAALKDSTAHGAYGLMFAMRPLLPELEKRVPARAAQLRQRMAEMDKQLDPRSRAWMQFDSVMSKPPETILEEAAKAPADVRPHLYSAAAYKLLKAGDAERARQVATEHVRGEEREQMLGLIEQAEMARAFEKGGAAEAREAASRIKSKERRARALAELSAAFALKGDRKTALQLLEEARGLVDTHPDNEREVEALLEVGRAYALVEPAKTFELIDPLVNQANDMLTAAALLEKFGQGGGVFRKGEMLIWMSLSLADGSYARHVKALAELARVDFDRTKATADRFNRDEVRLAVRLTIARSILSDRLPETAPFGAAGAALGGAGVLSQ